MSTRDAERQPGQFARDRFVKRRRAWRRRLWWAFPVVFLVPLAIEVPIILLTNARPVGFALGIALGIGATTTMLLFDSPPHYIEAWRTGSDGEKATARELRPLLKKGWTLFNDIETAFGNIDHVLVGPAGVFMVESKRLSGQVRVTSGKLVVRWREDPGDGYNNETVAARARGAAFDVHARLKAAGVDLWVQPIVVLWSDFEQGSIKSAEVAWIRGSEIRKVLEARPVTRSGVALEQLTIATQAAVNNLRSSAAGEREPL